MEEQGGLLTVDGTSRRRSPGGVFLWLVKQAATAAQRLQIWPPAATAASDGTAAAGAPTRRKAKSGGGGGADTVAAGKGGGKGGKSGGKGGKGGKGGGKGGKGAKAAAKNEYTAAPLAVCGDPAAHPGAADPAGGEHNAMRKLPFTMLATICQMHAPSAVHLTPCTFRRVMHLVVCAPMPSTVPSTCPA